MFSISKAINIATIRASHRILVNSLSSIKNLSTESSDPVDLSKIKSKDWKKTSLPGSSYDNPILVPCTTSRTIVGCRCEEYSQNLNWFYLDEGEPLICDCNVYFKLQRVSEDTEIDDCYKVMTVDEEVINECARTILKKQKERKEKKRKEKGSFFSFKF